MGTSFFRCLIVLSSLVGISFINGHAYGKGDQCAAVKTQVDCGKKAGCAWGGKSCSAKKAAAPAKKTVAAPAKKPAATPAKSKPVAKKPATPGKKAAPVAKKAEPKKPAPPAEEPAVEEPAEDSMGDMPTEEDAED